MDIRPGMGLVITIRGRKEKVVCRRTFTTKSEGIATHDSDSDKTIINCGNVSFYDFRIGEYKAKDVIVSEYVGFDLSSLERGYFSVYLKYYRYKKSDGKPPEKSERMV